MELLRLITIWNEPTLEELARLPPLYASEDVSVKDKLIYEHFFIFACDWYVAEYDLKDQIFFGFAILNEDYQNAEWGYISYQELREVNVKGFEVDRDMYWEVKKASEIEKIVKGGGV